MFDPRQVERQMREAQRRAEAELKRQIDQHNREQQRRVDEHNRRAAAHNRQVVGNFNREVERVNAHNAAVDAQKNGVIGDLNRRLALASAPSYTPRERELAGRVQDAVSRLEARECDVFLSYARIDGAETGEELRRELVSLEVTVWFDEIEILPGKSQSLQMDRALQKARAGVALLTPAYLAGRFWTERELGALLHKATLIPVLHGVTFADVAQYSGILPDLAGFESARDSIEVIAQKIAVAVRPPAIS